MLHLNQRSTTHLRSGIVKTRERSKGVRLPLRRSLELCRLELLSRTRGKGVLTTLPKHLTIRRRRLRIPKLTNPSVDSDLNCLHHLHNPGLLTVFVD